jgi:hypothetical protein
MYTMHDLQYLIGDGLHSECQNMAGMNIQALDFALSNYPYSFIHPSYKTLPF